MASFQFSEIQCTTHAQADKLQRLQTRTCLASTASSSVTLTPHCTESRYDATRRTSTIHKYIFQIVPHAQHPQEFSFSTPVTRHGHPCNPDNVYWETSMVEATIWIWNSPSSGQLESLKSLIALRRSYTPSPDTGCFKNTSPKTSRRSRPSL